MVRAPGSRADLPTSGQEVWLMLDEEIGTRIVDSAKRSPLPGGLVRLHL